MADLIHGFVALAQNIAIPARNREHRPILPISGHFYNYIEGINEIRFDAQVSETDYDAAP